MLQPLVWMWLLAQDDPEAAALDQFRAAYRSPRSAARAEAVTALARTRHEKVLARLGALLLADEAAVRIASARGLGEFKDWKAKASANLLKGFSANVKMPEVQAAVLESLGRLGEESSLPVLHAAFREKDVRVAKAAIEATGVFKSAESMEPLIELMKDLERFLKKGQSGGYAGPKGAVEEGQSQQFLQDLRQAALASVQKITGEGWTQPYEWEIWWRKNKATFKVPKQS